MSPRPALISVLLKLLKRRDSELDRDFNTDSDTDIRPVWETDEGSSGESTVNGRKQGRWYTSVHVIFISWIADQQNKYIDEVRDEARNFGCKKGRREGIVFHKINVDGSNAQKFYRDFNASLAASKAARNLAVIVYLGGIRYLGGISSQHSSVAHIHSLRTTSLFGTIGAKYIPWDLQVLHGVEADVLFMTNFASREFLRCLRFKPPEPIVQNEHRLELLTFNSNDAKSFAECLSEFNDIQQILERSNPIGFSLDAVCKEFAKRQVRHTIQYSMQGRPIKVEIPYEPRMVIGEDLRMQVKHIDFRRDIISGTQDIWLTSPCPMFSPEHVKLKAQDISRQAKLLVKPPTGSRAEIWKMLLDYQSDIADPRTIGTICVAVKRFIPPSSDTTQSEQLRKTFQLERDNLIKMVKWPHPNILTMLGSFELVRGGSTVSFNLIFPFATGDDLANFMRLPLSDHADLNGPYPLGFVVCEEYGAWAHGVLDECAGLLSALAYIHHGLDGQIIIHRDIKPANILIHERRFKLADFGASRIKSSATASATARWAGTETYSPPELLQPRDGEERVRFGRARDVWALGCVLLELAVMLSACRHGDVMPSVEGFRMARTQASEKPGEDPGTDAFAQTMECVRATAELITQLKDVHLSCLVNVATSMLDVNPDTRPQASVMHDQMTRAYAEIVDECHIDYKPPVREVSRRDTQATRPTLPEPDELARFWYLAFWHNNYHRFYPVKPDTMMILFMVLAGFGLAVAFTLIIVLDVPITKMGIWSVLRFPVLGTLLGLFLFWLALSPIPCYFLMWVLKRQAVTYLEPSTAVTGGFQEDSPDILAEDRNQTLPASQEGRTESGSPLNDAPMDEIDVEEDQAISDSQRRHRSRFAETWNRSRAGAKAGLEAAAWMRKRIFKPMWRSLVYTQTLVDAVANFSVYMENQRWLRRDQAMGRTGPIAL